MTDETPRPPTLEEIVADATRDAPDTLAAVLEEWIPLEHEAGSRGPHGQAVAREVLEDARYSSLARALGRLRADVSNVLEVRTTGEPHDGDYREEIEDRQVLRIEVDALEEGIERLRHVLGLDAFAPDVRHLHAVTPAEEDPEGSR
jgi:hypothetical protein